MAGFTGTIRKFPFLNKLNKLFKEIGEDFDQTPDDLLDEDEYPNTVALREKLKNYMGKEPYSKVRENELYNEALKFKQSGFNGIGLGFIKKLRKGTMSNNDAINNILGDISFSFGKVIDKVKSTATDAAAKYQEMSPQGQAIKAGVQQFGKGGKTSPTASRMSTTPSRAIPTTSSSYKGKALSIKDLIGKLSKRKIFKIPVLYIGIGGAVLVGLPFLRKIGRKK